MLLQETVSRAARVRPDAIAVVDGQEQLTYRQLDEVSNRLARLLISSGCRKGDRVGILLAKSIPAIAGMVGTLKAGAIYVPMDTAGPPIRLKRIIDVCEPRFILYAGPGADLLNSIVSDQASTFTFRGGWLEAGRPPEHGGEVAFTWSDCLSGASEPPSCLYDDGDAAHILFTSGSTGVPKGVIITHRNVSSFLNWAARYFGASPSDRISCHPPLHFDLSTFDIYGTFLAGANCTSSRPE